MYVIPTIVNSDFVQEDLPKDVRLLYDSMISYLQGQELPEQIVKQIESVSSVE